MRQLKINITPTYRTDKTVSVYLNDISRIPTITADEEVDLIRKIRERGDEKAKNKLIQSNLRFVVSVAKHYQHQGLPLIDLISEGNIGLIKAAERFDETRGFKFISYAVWWIRQSIIQAINEQCRVVNLPQSQIALRSKVNQFIAKFEQDNARRPSVSEIAEELDIEEKIINRLIDVRQYSIDTPLQDDDTTTFSDTLRAEDEPHQDQSSLATDLNTVVKQVLDSREAFILYHIYGINCQPCSYEEIGYKLNLSRERVRQLKANALKKLNESQGINLLMKYN